MALGPSSLSYRGSSPSPQSLHSLRDRGSLPLSPRALVPGEGAVLVQPRDRGPPYGFTAVREDFQAGVLYTGSVLRWTVPVRPTSVREDGEWTFNDVEEHSVTFPVGSVQLPKFPASPHVARSPWEPWIEHIPPPAATMISTEVRAGRHLPR